MKIRADGKDYAIEQFDLGEFRLLKRDFGVEAINKLNPADPDHLVGFLFVAMKRQDSNVTVEQVEKLTEVQMLDDEGNEVTEEEAAEGARPPAPAADAEPDTG